MKINPRIIKNIAITEIILAILIGLLFGFYSSSIGGRASLGYSNNGNYFVGSVENKTLVSVSVWQTAVIFEAFFKAFFYLAIVSGIYVAVWFFFLRD